MKSLTSVNQTFLLHSTFISPLSLSKLNLLLDGNIVSVNSPYKTFSSYNHLSFHQTCCPLHYTVHYTFLHFFMAAVLLQSFCSMKGCSCHFTAPSADVERGRRHSAERSLANFRLASMASRRMPQKERTLTKKNKSEQALLKRHADALFTGLSPFLLLDLWAFFDAAFSSLCWITIDSCQVPSNQRVSERTVTLCQCVMSKLRQVVSSGIVKATIPLTDQHIGQVTLSIEVKQNKDVTLIWRCLNLQHGINCVGVLVITESPKMNVLLRKNKTKQKTLT